MLRPSIIHHHTQVKNEETLVTVGPFGHKCTKSYTSQNKLKTVARNYFANWKRSLGKQYLELLEYDKKNVNRINRNKKSKPASPTTEDVNTLP